MKKIIRVSAKKNKKAVKKTIKPKKVRTITTKLAMGFLTAMLIAVIYALDKIPGLMKVTGLESIQLGIAPFVIPAISAGLGGLLNLFGDDPEKMTLQDLMDMGYQPYDTNRESKKLRRTAENLKKRRRQNLLAQSASRGLDNTATNYGTEEDIDNSVISGISNIEAQGSAEKNRLAQILAGVNAGIPNAESDVSKFAGGALQGGNIGLEIMKLFPDLMNDAPQAPAGTTVSTTSPINNINTELDIPEPNILKEIQKADENMNFDTGGEPGMNPMGLKAPYGETLERMMWEENPYYQSMRKLYRNRS